MLKKSSLLVWVVILFVSVWGVSAQTEAFVEGECVVDVPATLGDYDVLCGMTIVPLQHDEPNGDTIQLATLVVKSPAADANSTPLVMLQGGPGGATIETFIQVLGLPAGANFLAGRDVILFDQRGTGFSEPTLFCDETTQLTYDTLAQDLSVDELVTLNNEALGACAERLRADGINLSAFDSYENAQDITSLVQALGYKDYDLYGVSYGSLLAQHVMQISPEGLRSVILDAVAPTDLNFITQVPYTANRSFTALFDACLNDSGCNEAYPNLEEAFNAGVDQLNASPITIQIIDPASGDTVDFLVNGYTYLSTMFSALYVAEFIPNLPAYIVATAAGDVNWLVSVFPLLSLSSLPTLSYGMNMTVLCAEDADFTQADVNITDVNPKIVEFYTAVQLQYLDVCPLFDVEALPASVDDPVVVDIPTLILSGEFDPITPPEFGQRVADYLPTNYSFVVNGNGHGVLTSACGSSIVDSFLKNPSASPDATCLADLKVSFALPFSGVTFETIELADFGLSVAVPQGWEEIATGTFSGDQTFLVYQAVPGFPPQDIAGLIINNLGASEFSQDTRTETINDREWIITDIPALGVRIAAADFGAQTVLTLLQTQRITDFTAIADGILLPALAELVLQ